MRDDLHRTVAVSRPLRRVLRYAVRPADRNTRLPQAIDEAVRLTLAQQIRKPWLDVVRESLSQSDGDLFREMSAIEVARQCGASAITPLEREVAECMRARAAFRQASRDLLPAAMREVAKRVEERACEQLASVVGQGNAGQLRRILRDARRQCQPENLIDSVGHVTSASQLPPRAINLDEQVGS